MQMEVDEGQGSGRKRKEPTGGFQSQGREEGSRRRSLVAAAANAAVVAKQGSEEANNDYEEVDAEVDLSEYDCPPFYCNFLSK